MSIENFDIYDQITTTITINLWSLFKRSKKKSLALEYDAINDEDNYLLNLAFSARQFGQFEKIYLKMPLKDYFKYKFSHWKNRSAYGYCLVTKNKYLLEKEKLLKDARNAYKIEDKDIYKKIYQEYFGKENGKNV